MTTRENNVPATKYKAGSLPNFEKLTALLNQQDHPRKTLRILVEMLRDK